LNDGPQSDVVIRTPDQRLRVFVSSTLGELAGERRAVSRAVSALRLTPVMFELGARPHPPRELYRAYLAQSDIFIGLYWQRYGWIAPGMEVSGLEDEFALSLELPRLLYVKAPALDREPRLADLLARMKSEASYRTFTTPSELGRLVRDDLATLLSERFAAARSAPPSSQRTRALPAATTSLVGRERAIDDVAELLVQPEVRLVTLTGPGGVGKTRLAVAVAERVRDGFGSGTVFVPLAAVTQPELVAPAIGRAVGADLTGMRSALDAVVERFGDGRWLLVLDNLEHVLDAARELDELLVRCRGVAMLTTSRTVLQLRAEREYPVPPLPLPPDPTTVPVDDLASSPTVALFLDRARAVRPDFRLTAANAAAVVEICRRLEGLPLAIELAAARTRLLEPDALVRRLAGSLDALGAGPVDMPERQHKLRATVSWSVGLLDDAERSLLETAAVFVDGWTVEGTAEVAGLDEDRALELTDALARHSLVQLDHAEVVPRSRMLETVREFVAERLSARADCAQIERRHAGYYRTLAEQVDVQLRGAGHGESLERLDAEAGNLAAAVRWYLVHDTAPLPHLFRVLWVFWELRDRLGEARAWVEQLLPIAETLDPKPRAELLWTAAATASEVGDDRAALAASDRLLELLEAIDEPYLRAVSELALAWTAPIVGDVDCALRRASSSLEQLRGQDEPYWTAVALLSVGYLETEVGRQDSALRHLNEARDLTDRLDYAWLSAWSRFQLGRLAVMRGRLEEGRTLLDEALSLGLATHSTRSVTLSLVAFAQLVLAEGDPERSAQLAGAAEGLRRRIGLRAWPTLRRAEAELVDQIRQTLGEDGFARAFAFGSELGQREAVAAARAGHDRT
jgi:predicted ATPase